DVLPNRTLEEQIASGFNRCNMTTSEGGAIDDEYYVLYTRDRTETTSQVWLGLTAGCAVCHDHKYDRLSQKEFYSMSAFFNNTTQKAMDGNVKDTPPVVVVPTRADRPRWDALGPQKKNAKKKVDRRRDTAQEEYAAWLATASPDVFMRALPSGDPELHALLADNQDLDLEVTVGGQRRCLPLKTNASWQNDGAVAAN